MDESFEDLLRAGRFAEVLAMLTDRSRHPTLGATDYFRLGIAARGLGDNAVAVGYYSESWRLQPGSARLMFNLANALMESGEAARGSPPCGTRSAWTRHRSSSTRTSPAP